MRILLLGSGGREHVLAWKIIQSPLCKKLFVAPGNAGTSTLATNLDIADDDFEKIREACLEHLIDMVIGGPEGPLVKGIVDYFENDPDLRKIPVIGPNMEAAQLEGSKDFSKRIMKEYGIPTAAYATFTREDINAGIEYLKQHSLPIVLKADGLAAGKGVLICNTHVEAINEFREMLEHAKFGYASSKVVVEEFLEGIELSVFALTDGNSYCMLPSAKDYKRVGEGDTGLNTGGMGAISPVPFADAAFMKKVEEAVVKPLIAGLKNEHILYKGFLFIGLMNNKGEPYVVEFNCRLGDPETEVVLPRIKNDIMEMFKAVAENRVNEIKIDTDESIAATVFLVSGGYPGDYKKGKQIEGSENVKDSLVFHAGTRMEDGKLVTNGGRVMAITSFGRNIPEAVNKSLQAASLIKFEGINYRRDIGLDIIRYTS
jgi:phosphoribosylamine--glycine ligase